jgi:inositol phosphorylceramide mannosyltransferase catalytic subunit
MTAPRGRCATLSHYEVRIPKIIHQTWKNRCIPEEFQSFSCSWKNHHPSWEYRLWTDADNREFISTNYDWFLPFYDNYQFNIQRADAVRYFILHAYGGMYVDLDFECLKPIEPLLRDHECVLGLEPERHCQYHGVEQIISNAFMASMPSHPFLYAIMKGMAFHIPAAKHRNDLVLETTGPLMLNRVFGGFPEPETVTLVPPEFLFPLDYEEARKFTGSRDPQFKPKLRHAYGIHYHWGSWWGR